MSILKRIIPVVLVSVLVMNWSFFVFAGQEKTQGKLEENRKQLIETNSCPGCDLSGLNLDRVNLTGANLEGANLSHVTLHLASLAKANLRNTDLRDAEFGGADLAGADLRGADLIGASFVGAYLAGAKVDNEVVLNKLSEEHNPDNVSDQDITTDVQVEATAQDKPSAFTKDENTAPSSESGFFDTTLERMKGLLGLGAGNENKAVTEQQEEKTGNPEELIQATAAVQAMSARDAVAADIIPAQEVQSAEDVPSAEEPGFFDKTLAGIKGLFGQSKSVDHEAVADVAPSAQGEEHVPPVTSQPPAVPAVVEGNQTVNSEPTGAENKDRAIQEEKPSPENKRDDDILSADKADPVAEIEKNKQRLLDGKGCYGCNLHGVDLTGKDLGGADLEGADLSGSRLTSVDLENANLKGAILVGVDLRNADLRGADLYKANLSGADLTGAKLEGALLDEAQLSNSLGYEQKGGQ